MFGTDSEVEACNTEKYRFSRLYFADRAAYGAQRAKWAHDKLPHCVNCTWDQDHPTFDSPQLNQYLAAAAGGILDSESLRILCSW